MSGPGPSESSFSDCMHLIKPVAAVWSLLNFCHSSMVGLLPRGGPDASDADEEAAPALAPWSDVSSTIVGPGAAGPLFRGLRSHSPAGPIGGLPCAHTKLHLSPCGHSSLLLMYLHPRIFGPRPLPTAPLPRPFGVRSLAAESLSCPLDADLSGGFQNDSGTCFLSSTVRILRVL